MAIINTSKGNRPDIRPSLLLDFANSKSLDPRVNFVRSSSASYYDGKTTTRGEQNLLKDTRTFHNSSSQWAFTSNLYNTENAAIAPNNQTEASELVDSTVMDGQLIFADGGQNLVGNPETNDLVLSCYFKLNGGTTRYPAIILRSSFYNWAGAVYNLSAGTYTQKSGTGGAVSVIASGMYDVGNGWWRCWTKVRDTETDGAAFRITLSASSTGADIVDNYASGRYTAVTGAGIYTWGPQAERDILTNYTVNTSTTRPLTRYQPVLKYASANQPRFDHNPQTGESLGLTVEVDRTNLSPNKIPGSVFAQNEVQLITDVVAPDGTVTAQSIRDYNGSGQKHIQWNTTTTQGSYYTFSFYAKALETSQLYLRIFSDSYAVLSGDYGQVTGVCTLDPNTAQSGQIRRSEDLGNGWFRFWVTFVNNLSSTTRVRINLQTAGNYNGAGNYKCAIWGTQLELGRFLTSYIETTGSTATRSQENVDVDGDAFAKVYRDDETTLFVSGRTNTDDIHNANLLSLVNTTDSVNNRLGVSFRTGGGMLIDNYYVDGGSVAYDASSLNLSPYSQVALRIKNEDFGFAVDGNLYTTTTNVGYSPTKNKMIIGGIYNQDTQAVSVEKIALYPAGLSDSVLTNMTGDGE